MKLWPFKRKSPVVVISPASEENLRLQKQLGFPIGDDDACWTHQFRMFVDWEKRIRALEERKNG